MSGAQKKFLRWILVFLVSLGSVVCTRITHRVSPDEQAVIQLNFEQAVQAKIKEEGKKIHQFAIDHFEQTANDRVRIKYHVMYKKIIDGEESAEETFQSTVVLKRVADGGWEAAQMNPDSLTVEFAKGLAIKAVPSPSPTATPKANPE